ncbi:MAG: hypothetical protein KKA60_04900, partial [Proteobacteria bacterium]|nr:hypothetical protein [Pseudomonadota bacterium]
APGPGGATQVVKTFEEARALRDRHMPRISRLKKLRDAAHAGWLFQRHYLGVEPGSLVQGACYARKLSRATREKAPGHIGNPV